MKTSHVKGLGIIVPKKQVGSVVKTPDDMPALHAVIVFCGRRGSGKSFGAISLVKHYMDAGSIDRVFIISPTIHSNKALIDLIKVADEDFYDEPNKAALDDVLEKVEIEAQEYEEYHVKMKQYQKYLKYVKSGKGHIRDDELTELWDGASIVPPKHKWDGRKPGLCLIIDDAQGSPLMMPKARLMNMIIKHRHHGTFKEEPGALGITVIFCCQSLKAAGGGLPRAIRGNCTGFALFRTKDEKELMDAAQECAGEVGIDTFFEVYDMAMKEDHGFLYVDFAKKECHPSMFRSKLDKFLIPKDKAKNNK